MGEIDRSRAWWLTRWRALAAAAATTVSIIACGGGSEFVAVAGFLGTGGGQFYVDMDPDTEGFQSCDEAQDGVNCQVSLSLSIDPDEIDTGFPDLFSDTRTYPVRVLSAENGLDECRGTSGTVEERRVVIETGGECLRGRYDTVNRIASDDGDRDLYKDVFPNMTIGVWVDVDDEDRRLVFESNTGGCEIRGTTVRPFTATLVTSNIGEIVQTPDIADRRDRTYYSSIVVADGDTWTGEFIGISGLRLRTTGDDRVDFERRDEEGSCD